MPVEKQKTYESGTFIQLAHTTLSDPNLSWGALGLLHYMLSKPSEWKFTFSDLTKASKDGKHTIRSYLKELVEIGYVERAIEHDEKGQIMNILLAREIILPKLLHSKKPDAVKPNTVKPDAVNQPLNYIDNKIYVKDKLYKKDLSQEKREKNNKREKKEETEAAFDKLRQRPSTEAAFDKLRRRPVKISDGPITPEEQEIYTWAQRDPFWSMYIKDLSSLRKHLLQGTLKNQYDRATQKNTLFDRSVVQEALRLSAQYPRK